MSPVYVPGKLVLAKDYTPGDPFFSNVSLLLKGDGTNGSQTIIDSSPSPKSATALPVGASGAKISTAVSDPFSDSAKGVLAFDGTGDYINCGQSSAYAFGLGNFTVEGWIRVSSFTNDYQTLCGTREGSINSTTSWSVAVIGENAGGPFATIRKSIFWYTNGTVSTGADTILLDTWHHIAATRDGTTLRLFIDGTLKTTVTNGQDLTGSILTAGGLLASNGTTGEHLNGYIDNLRITKGIARYTANFTPPTAPFADAQY